MFLGWGLKQIVAKGTARSVVPRKELVKHNAWMRAFGRGDVKF